KSAAKKLAAAATAVKKALAPVDGLRKKKNAALTQRDALGQSWQTAFAKLKNATRTAEDDGAHGLFEAIFRDDAPAPAAKTKGKNAPVAAPAPNGSSPSQPPP